MLAHGNKRGRERGFPEVHYYLVFVSRQVHGEAAVPCVPHLERAVLAGCDEKSAVGRPRTLVDLELWCEHGGTCSFLWAIRLAYWRDVAPKTLEKLAVPGVPEFLSWMSGNCLVEKTRHCISED